MTKKDVSLNDIAVAINDLATHMDMRFEQVDARFEQVDAELVAIRKDQRETRELLGQIDSRILGIESDIKEIYDRVVALEEKKPALTDSEARELIRKVDSVVEWAKKVSQKTGIVLPKL